MILSDRTLRERIESGSIGITPYDPDLIQPSSIDVRLGESLRVFTHHHLPIDPQDDEPDRTKPVFVGFGYEYLLYPSDFVLGTTLERIRVPDDLVSRVEGKSSLARLGLAIHATAGFIDPGFEGTITLEMTNLTRRPIILRPGMKIGQLSFMQMTTPAEFPYGHERNGSKYQGQDGPTASRYHENVTEPYRNMMWR